MSSGLSALRQLPALLDVGAICVGVDAEVNACADVHADVEVASLYQRGFEGRPLQLLTW